MKQKLVAFFLVIVMVASTLTAIAATTATPVSAATATKTTLSVSKTNPVIGQSVTFTVTLKAGTMGLSKPVKIWHTTNGVRYEDGIHNTVNGVYSFTQAFGSKGQRVYHAEFAATGTYGASSGTVTVNVQPIPTTTTMTASKTSPLVNEHIKITVTLKAGTTVLSKPVKVWHTANGVRYEDGIHNTVSGIYSFNQAFGSTGQRVYHAEFAGDNQYGASSGIVTVTVKIPTTLTLAATPASPYFFQTFTIGGVLKDSAGHPLVGKPVGIAYRIPPATTWTFYKTVTTDSNGAYSSKPYMGYLTTITFNAYFVTTSTYAGAQRELTVNAQKIPTTLTVTASNSNPKVGESVTITITLKAGNTGLSKPVKWISYYAGEFTRDEDLNLNNGVYQTTVTYPMPGTHYERTYFYEDSFYLGWMGEVIVNVQPA